MAQLKTKIELFLNSKIDFINDVIIQNDADEKGTYIKEWNLDTA